MGMKRAWVWGSRGDNAKSRGAGRIGREGLGREGEGRPISEGLQLNRNFDIVQPCLPVVFF